jgi:hypothetical protein
MTDYAVDWGGSGIVNGQATNQQAQTQLDEINRTTKRGDPIINLPGEIGLGAMAGRQRASYLYGMDQQEIGSNVQDIIAMRKKNLEGNNPATQALRRDTAGQQRNLASAQKKTGVTGTMAEAQKRQVSAQGDAKAAVSEYQGKQQALSEYQKIIGNIAANSGSLEMGFGSLYGSNAPLPAQERDNGLFGLGFLGL